MQIGYIGKYLTLSSNKCIYVCLWSTSHGKAYLNFVFICVSFRRQLTYENIYSNNYDKYTL